MESLSKNTKALLRLAVGDSMLVQNQVSNHPSKWNITRTVVEYQRGRGCGTGNTEKVQEVHALPGRPRTR